MLINGTSVIERNNRPAQNQKVLLRSFFVEDGIYVNPTDISGVWLYQETRNTVPSSIFTSAYTTPSTTPLMSFTNSATLTTNVSFNTSNYSPATTEYGIFKINTGEYGVVLDGSLSLSGSFLGTTIPNQVSSAGNYIDVWVVKLPGDSAYRSFINRFTLHGHSVVTITDPLKLRSHNRLLNNRVVLGSKVDLKVTTDISIENRDIPVSKRNSIEDSLVSSCMIQIEKVNVDPNLPSRVTVSSFADTSNSVYVTTGNTMIFTWDTTKLYTLPALLNGTFGSLTGQYTIQVKYNLLNEVKQSPRFGLTII